MVKYLFNGKIQVFTNQKLFFHYKTNLQKLYGDLEIYNNILSVGYLSICW